MPVFDTILQMIGKTPMVKLQKIAKDLSSEIFVKLESFNPGSSIKDRPALGMIEAAEKQGILTKKSKIVEASSGNTGIGLAMICAVKGYELKLFMPENASLERRKIMKAYGANIELTPAEELMTGAVTRAENYAKTSDHIYLTNQFENDANPDMHRRTTALEIWDDMNKQVDVLVASIGTGGTITGIGEVLKKLNPNIHIIAVEPEASPVLSGGKPNIHKLEGMGAGFIPAVLNTSIYNEIVTVSADEAFTHSRKLAKLEGIFAGKSSGAALATALEYAKKTKSKKRIVVILPDTGERYLSTLLWE